ncbi:MAG: alanine:cation symporter family protein [Clostridiales bacterium]|nr:alanine:cation symporter family protein [Clostridiales bacterium]MDD7432042.1 alanine/glycine:cation symporter family protein [Clostridiales bacterium]MDY3061027.1 alanine/glycine:cation symporter family protein [Eubacteriales bacterium]
MLIFWIILSSALASLLQVPVAGHDFRFSAGIIVLITALLIKRELKPIPMGLATGLMVCLTRVIAASLSTAAQPDVLSYFLEVFFYLGYVVVYRLVVLKDDQVYELPLVIGLTLSDFGGNAVEYFVRLAFHYEDWNSAPFINLLIAAFVRSGLIILCVYLLGRFFPGFTQSKTEASKRHRLSLFFLLLPLLFCLLTTGPAVMAEAPDFLPEAAGHFLTAEALPVYPLLKGIKDFLWDNILLFALLGTGIFLSVVLRFPQLKYLFKTIRKMVVDIMAKKPARAGSMTPFQSLATSIAAQVGTGNIIGVASAVALGGPGAAFWMLLSAFFGMSTIFSEAVLAQLYREEHHGQKVGGPAYYILHGLKSRPFAILFALLCISGLGIVGLMVQSNAVVGSLHSAFGLPTDWISISLVVIVGVILAGGMDRIGKFSETVVPIMAFIYIFGSLLIILMNLDSLVLALKWILLGAFRPEAIGGGVLGISMREAARFGLARGLFSNEAGMGSTPHSHAVAEAEHPAEQGFLAMVGVFISTFLICLSTVLVNLSGGSYDATIPAGEMAGRAELMTQTAFQNNFGAFGEVFLAIALSCFALTTIVGWYFFAESNVKFLAGQNKFLVSGFRVVSLAFLAIGALSASGEFVWTLADLFMGLMALPNVIALVLLYKQTRAVLRDYEAGQEKGSLEWNEEKLKSIRALRLSNRE